MYSTCLFCNQSLGANQSVEEFPVGRRLAFDQRRGRLWVICRKCEKWNLTPLEERWEAIEECEKLFRDARKRVSTDNIGLARLDEGLELIRIGNPLRPEFAAWRYGDQFGRRFRKYLVTAGVGGGLYSILATAGIVGVWGGSFLLTGLMLLHNGRDVFVSRRTIARVPDGDGEQLNVRVQDAIESSIVPGEERYSWALKLRIGWRTREIVLQGDEARRVAARVVPHMNKIGAFKKQVDDSVDLIEECGGPERFLSWVARNPPKGFFADRHWLGVEMAVNEENERRALEGELAFLEAAWKDAEEIAAIADRLTLPREVNEKFDSLRDKNKR